MYFDSRTDPGPSREILDRYYDAGGHFIDTATSYAAWVDGYDKPGSEPLVGEWTTERGNRDDVFLTTKVGFDDGFRHGPIAAKISYSDNRIAALYIVPSDSWPMDSARSSASVISGPSGNFPPLEFAAFACAAT